MSEFEQNALDEEILEMANKGCGIAESNSNIGEDAASDRRTDFWPSVMESIEKDKKEAEEREKVYRKKLLRSRITKTVAWVSVCVAAVAALITVLYVPTALPWVVNFGTLCFVVAASIMIDRLLQWWRP